MTPPLQVLVVDDEALIRLNLRALLEDLGYSVAEAANGREALEWVEREAPDLVLTDMRMPEMDGMSLIAQLVANHPELPVVVISGTGTIRDAIQTVRKGAWDYIAKPVRDEDDFEIVITRVLERARLIRENRNYAERLEELVRERTRELRDSEARYRSLLNSVSSYVYTTTFRDGAPVGTQHTHGCEALTGFTPQEFAADPDLWFRMVYEEDRPLVLDMVRRILDASDPITLDHRLLTKSGSLRWVQSTLVPHRDAHGGLACYDGIVTDISERKQLEEQLRQSQKMEAIGVLAGGVAHDFNNILTVIIGYGNMMLMHKALDNMLQEMVAQILNSAERAAHLTRSLLTFSHKQVLNARSCDLNEVVKNIEKFLIRVIGEDIGLKIATSGEKLGIFADCGQIEQILINLSTNARDAMPKGGLLTLETSLENLDEAFVHFHGYGEPGRYASVQVSDTGCGMDQTTRSKVFEPFFTTKDVGKGTGLGMAIVYGIVKQHKGYITVSSEPGKGTTFKVYLPVADAGSEAHDAAQEPETPPGGTETILLVEDDPAVQTMMKRILDQSGYRTILADNGLDAVEQYRQRRKEIQLVLMDMIMPTMGGREASEQIKRIEPDARFLFVSGYTDEIVRDRGEFEEGRELIMKPISPRELTGKVREILDRP